MILDISIVISNYNESFKLRKILESLSKIIKKNYIPNYEIIVIDDGSKSKHKSYITYLVNSVFSSLKIKLISYEKNIGLGKLFLKSIDCCTKKHFMWIPGDNSISRESLIQIFQNHLEEDEILLVIPDNEFSRNKLRLFLSKFYVAIINFISDQKIKYYNGPNVYPLKYLKLVPYRFKSFVLLSYLSLFLIIKLNLNYKYQTYKLIENQKFFTSAISVRNIFDAVKLIFLLLLKKI